MAQLSTDPGTKKLPVQFLVRAQARLWAGSPVGDL